MGLPVVRSLSAAAAFALLGLVLCWGCTSSTQPSTSAVADSLLVDSIRATLDGVDADASGSVLDTTTVRRWTDRAIALGDSLTHKNPDKAEVLFESGLRAGRALGDSARTVRSLTGLGRAHVKQSRPDTAIETFREALSVARPLGKGPEGAEILRELADVLQGQGAYDNALSRYRSALARYRASGMEGEAAHLLSDMGIVYAKTGRFEKALTQWQEALTHFQATSNPTGTAGVVGNMGIVYKNRGQYDKALEKYQTALSIQRKRGTKDGIARSLSNLGVVYRRQDRYQKALNHLREAVSLHRSLGNQREVASTLNNIGVVYRMQGQYEKALQRYEESLEIKRDLGDRHGVGTTLNNIGIVYKHQGKFDDAREKFRASGAVWRALGDRDGHSSVLNNLGTLYRLQGRPDSAAHFHRKALSIKRAVGDRDGVATTLHNLGDVYRHQGRVEDALRSYRRATALNRTMGRPRRVAANLEARGLAYLASNDVQQATDTLKRAVRLVEDIRRNATSPEGRRSLLSTQMEAYRGLAAAYVRAGQPGAALRAVERARARLLADRIAGTARGDTSVSIPSTDALQAALDPDEGAILYANTGARRPLLAIAVARDTVLARQLPRSAFQRNMVAAYAEQLSDRRAHAGPLVNALGERLGPADETTAGLAQVVRLYRHRLTHVEGRDSVQVDLARRLYDLLVRPLESWIAEKRALKIVPTGVLSYLPMEALRGPEGSYLIEEKAVTYAQSLTVLRQLQQRKYGARRRSLLAMGGAEYGTDRPTGDRPLLAESRATVETEEHATSLFRAAERRLKRGRSLRPTYDKLGYGRWADLFGSKLEVQKLSRIAGREGDVRIGSSVSEEELRRMSTSGRLAEYRRIHFATHGIALPAAPKLSGLVLSQVGDGEGRSSRDGYLTMQEIAELDLAADVAVLSACRTGLGRIIAGEGVVSLSHAFLRAGANATLVSQWRVLDWSTQQFMASVYREIGPDVAFADAVVRVKREFISGRFGKRNADPLRWAPFVYYGRE